MRTPAPSTLLLLLSLLAPVACDVDETLVDDAELEQRLTVVPVPVIQPYHGRWEGPMTDLDGNPLHDYDATIVLTPDLCTIRAGDILSAEWDYYNLGITCTSDLELLGIGLLPGGTRVWTFYDHSLTGPCIDGYVDLTETADPNVMHHAWRNLGIGGAIDAEGLLTRNGLCTPGFGSGS